MSKGTYCITSYYYNKNLQSLFDLLYTNRKKQYTMIQSTQCIFL